MKTSRRLMQRPFLLALIAVGYLNSFSVAHGQGTQEAVPEIEIVNTPELPFSAQEEQALQDMFDMVMGHLQETECLYVNLARHLTSSNPYITIANKPAIKQAILETQREIQLVVGNRTLRNAISLETIAYLARINQELIEHFIKGVQTRFVNWSAFRVNTTLTRNSDIMQQIIHDPMVLAQLIDSNQIQTYRLNKNVRSIGLNPLRRLVATLENYNEAYDITTKIKKTLVTSVMLGFAGLGVKTFINAGLAKAVPFPVRILQDAGSMGDISLMDRLGDFCDSFMDNPVIEKTLSLISSASPILGTAATLNLISFNAKKPLLNIDILHPFTQWKHEYQGIKNGLRNQWEKFYQFIGGTPSARNQNEAVEPEVTFDDIQGNELLKSEWRTDYIEPLRRATFHNEHIDRLPITLLEGNPGSGKSLFAEALAGELKKTIPGIIFFKVPYSLITHKDFGMEGVMELAKANAPVVLFIDEMDLLDLNREGNKDLLTQFLTSFGGIIHNNKKPVILIAATNKAETIDFALYRTGRIEKRRRLEYPKSADREFFLRRQLEKNFINTISEATIRQIIAETEEQSLEKIKEIISEAIKSAKDHSQVPQDIHFRNALDKCVEHITPWDNNWCTQREKEEVAAYQAAKALAITLLTPENHLARVTLCKAQSLSDDPKEWVKALNELGETFTFSGYDSAFLANEENIIKEVKILRAGIMGQRLLKNTVTPQYKKAQHERALKLCKNLVSEGLELDSDNFSTSQKNELIEAAHTRLHQYEEEIKSLLLRHHASLERIYNALLENITLSGEEVRALIYA